MNFRVLFLLLLMSGSTFAQVASPSPNVHLGLTEANEYRELNLRMSQNNEQPLFCPAVQFRIPVAVYTTGVGLSELCTNRITSDSLVLDLKRISINSKETLYFPQVDRNYLPNVLQLNFDPVAGAAVFHTNDDSAYRVRLDNAPFQAAENNTSSLAPAQLSFCPRSINLTSTCVSGCAPGERLVEGRCARDIVRDIAISDEQACAINSAFEVQCWGKVAPTPQFALRFKLIMSRDAMTCGITEGDKVECWGPGADTTPSGTSGHWLDFAVARGRSCGVTDYGQVQCFGTKSRIPSEIEMSEEWTSIAITDDESCAIDGDGKLSCWNNMGRATHPLADVSVKAIAGGSRHFCAKADDGSLHCWGKASTRAREVPSGLKAVNSFSVGRLHSCAVTDVGKTQCWGEGVEDLLKVPPDLPLARSVIAGNRNTCIVTITGDLLCWGDNKNTLNVPPRDFR